MALLGNTVFDAGGESFALKSCADAGWSSAFTASSFSSCALSCLSSASHAFGARHRKKQEGSEDGFSVKHFPLDVNLTERIMSDTLWGSEVALVERSEETLVRREWSWRRKPQTSKRNKVRSIS